MPVAGVLQSILQLTALVTELTVVVQRINNGEEITDAEWELLKQRINKANADWETA